MLDRPPDRFQQFATQTPSSARFKIDSPDSQQYGTLTPSSARFKIDSTGLQQHDMEPPEPDNRIKNVVDLILEGGTQPPTAPITVLSKSDFLAGFTPPDYLVDGILQRRFVYAMTGQTGHAKTAIALLLARLVSSTPPAALSSHGVDKGRVVYFVGENPDDIRMRVIGADSQRNDDPTTDRISFIPGVFNIEQMHGKLEAKADELGGLDLVIVDTSAAYFLGNEELSNTQMGAHARMLRRLTTLPGGPCVLVLCHPIKHVAEPSQLLPRGGGAFLNEMDGNLTAWRHDVTLIDLHHGKMRGPGFEPIAFRLEPITTTELMDKKGRLIPTIQAVPISDIEQEREARHSRDDDDRLLAALKVNANRSVADLAKACKWITPAGDPQKSKVHRTLVRLEKANPKLVSKDRDQWRLTDAGKAAADRAYRDLEKTVQSEGEVA
jgi:hypothetical protein